MKKHHIIFLAIIICGVKIYSQNNPNVLPWHLDNDYNTYLILDVHKQYHQRRAELAEVLKSRQTMIKYKEECRKKYLKILGKMPPRKALNVQITGTLKKTGFRLEKIIYESVPDHHVTADLYIPDGYGKFPGIIQFCGHEREGKYLEQQIAMSFATKGFVVLVIDPVAQGERFQITDKNGKPLTSRATNEHTLLNAGSNVVGESVVKYELWDNVRGLDYLSSLPEVDTSRLGCVGVSGGATQVTYFAAFDPRIKVAVPVSYVSSRERTLELDGPSDGCQHIPNEGKNHFEISDFLIMYAPKPLLIVAGLHDFVDYWGVKTTYAELKKVYGAFGDSSKVNVFTWDDGHGMAKPKREAAVRWFRKWMYNDDKPVEEKLPPWLSEKDVQCTETGQVNTSFPGELDVQDLNYNLAKKYKADRTLFLKNADASELKNKVLNLLGISLPQNKIYTEDRGKFSRDNYNILKVIVRREGEMPVPCLVYIPQNISASSSLEIYLNDNGKDAIAENDSIINSYMNKGEILLLADLRGIGETADQPGFNDPKYANREYRNAMTSMHIGRTIVGQRVIDIISLLDYAGENPDTKDRRINIFTDGILGPSLIYAAYFDKRINKAIIYGSFKSYVEFTDSPLRQDMYSNVLYGVLKYFDLPDIIERAGIGRIEMLDSD